MNTTTRLGARLVLIGTAGMLFCVLSFGVKTHLAYGASTHTLSYFAGSNGSISGTTPQVITDGSDGKAIDANPDAGYHFDDWSDGSVQNPRTDTKVANDISVTASFVAGSSIITTQSASDITDTGAHIEFTVGYSGQGTPPTKEGIEYSIDNSFSLQVSLPLDLGVGSGGNFSTGIGLSNLACNTQYNYKGYVTDGTNTAFSNIKSQSFTTAPCEPPTVTTVSANSVSSNGEELSGSIDTTGSTLVTNRGFQYGTDIKYGLNFDESSPDFGTGNFSVSVSNISCNTLYHYRAYATSGSGIAYGSDANFTSGSCDGSSTSPSGGNGGNNNGGNGGGGNNNNNGPTPTVNNTNVTNITQTSATLGGNITDTGDKGLTIDSQGMYYMLTSNLQQVLNGKMKPLQTPTDKNITLPGLGIYTEQVSSLTCGTEYDYVSFANNSSGGQGIAGTNDKPDAESFTTSPCASSVMSGVPQNNNTTILVPPTAMQFLHTLGFGSQGDDVKRLQVFLNSHGSVLAATSYGSPLMETTYFGPLTVKALAQYQEKNGIAPAAGFFGPATLNFINQTFFK